VTNDGSFPFPVDRDCGPLERIRRLSLPADRACSPLGRIRRLSLLETRPLKETEPQITSGDFAYHDDLVGEAQSPSSPRSPAAIDPREAEGGLIPPREPGKFCRFSHRAGKFQPFNQRVRWSKLRATIEWSKDARTVEAERRLARRLAREYEAAFESEASKHWYPPR